jgi:hypothetical protein
MARLRTTPKKPSASTVETVNVLNGSKQDVDTSLSGAPGEPRPSTPEVGEPKETLTRTSPRKRKEPPTAVASSNKLRRVTRTSDTRVESTELMTTVPQQASSAPPPSVGRRQNVYDPPEADGENETAATATAPVPRKRVQLTRQGAKDPFEGHHEVGLPESSPAKGTRSHDKTSKTSTTGRINSKSASQTHGRKDLPNIMAQAPQQIEEVENVEPVEEAVSPRKNQGGRPRKPSKHGRGRGRPSKVAKNTSSRQASVDPADIDRSQPNDDQPDITDEAVQESSSSNAEPGPSRNAKKKTGDPELEAEVIAGLEDAVSLYSCKNAWTDLLVYAKKALQPSTSIKLKAMKAFLSTIKDVKSVYRKIHGDDISEEECGKAEEQIKDGTKQLKQLFDKIDAADPKEHDLTMMECIHEQVVPRMARLLSEALTTRFDSRLKTISIDSLNELVGLINIALLFRDLAAKAREKPEGLINGEGERILRFGQRAEAGLRLIKKKYMGVVSDHKVAVELEKEARRREKEIAYELQSTAAAELQRGRDKAKAYERKLEEERAKKAEAARKLEARRVEEDREWKTALMSNRSLEAERLRKKFGLPARPVGALDQSSRIESTVMDIDDFGFDEDLEQLRSRPRKILSNGSNQRPRARREPTEEIPAPVVEPQWTDRQTVALTWGLQVFRGPDRYTRILAAPEVRSILDGKNDFDLMQQALYIKQSMARAMDTGMMVNGEPLKDDWSWLRSV